VTTIGHAEDEQQPVRLDLLLATCRLLTRLPLSAHALMQIRCRLIALGQEHSPNHLRGWHPALYLYLLLYEAVQAANIHKNQ
jgi:hypothetical protein